MVEGGSGGGGIHVGGGVSLLLPSRLSPQGSPRISVPLLHPHSDSVSGSSACPIVLSDVSKHKDGIDTTLGTASSPRSSAISLGGKIMETATEFNLAPAVVEMTPEPISNTSDSKVAMEVTSDLPCGGVIKKMSKKEKRFHLSKDDGRYSELNPISPHEAKREFGESLRLKPVDPMLVGVASGSEDGDKIPSKRGPSFSSVPRSDEGGMGVCGSTVCVHMQYVYIQ